MARTKQQPIGQVKAVGPVEHIEAGMEGYVEQHRTGGLEEGEYLFQNAGRGRKAFTLVVYSEDEAQQVRRAFEGLPDVKVNVELW
jgi:hypothetical protein